MQYQNLLILGASGKVGQLAVKFAKERNYNITAVVRSRASIKNGKNINIIQGSVLDEDVLEKAIQGQDAVLSCLGIKRKSQSNPWSPLASPSHFTESVVVKAIPIMEKNGIQRFIAISSAGVGDSWDSVTPFLKFLIRSSNVKYAIEDFEKMENILFNSNIDSLTVRPVGLVDEESTNQAILVTQFKMSSKISRSDVAKWMLNALKREEQFKNPSEMIGW
jgi:putative NADH-flavin reductase